MMVQDNIEHLILILIIKMVEISIKADIKPVLKRLNNFVKQQVPYATRLTLNQLAYEAQQEVTKTAREQIDKPIGFTLRGFKYRKSSRADMSSAVYIQPIQAEYLQYIILGGQRVPKRGHTAIPVNIPLTDYGNIRGRRTGLLKKKTQFIANVNGVLGIWQRPTATQRRGKNKINHNRLELLTTIERTVDYEKRFKYFETVQKLVTKRVAPILLKKLALAIKTAK